MHICYSMEPRLVLDIMFIFSLIFPLFLLILQTSLFRVRLTIHKPHLYIFGKHHITYIYIQVWLILYVTADHF